MAEELTDIPRTAPQPPAGTPVVVARWVQLVMLSLAVLALYALAQAAGPVLLLFLVAAVIAPILNPLVVLVRRAHIPGTLAVIAQPTARRQLWMSSTQRTRSGSSATSGRSRFTTTGS